MKLKVAQFSWRLKEPITYPVGADPPGAACCSLPFYTDEFCTVAQNRRTNPGTRVSSKHFVWHEMYSFDHNL